MVELVFVAHDVDGTLNGLIVGLNAVLSQSTDDIMLVRRL